MRYTPPVSKNKTVKGAMNVIAVEDLSFHIGGRQILDKISFEVEAGGWYTSIIGPNGAGKSTLLKCIIRIYTGWSGSVRIKGKPMNPVYPCGSGEACKLCASGRRQYPAFHRQGVRPHGPAIPIPEPFLLDEQRGRECGTDRP